MASIPNSTQTTSLQPNGVNDDQPKAENNRLIHLLKGAALSGFGLACAFTASHLVANGRLHEYHILAWCFNKEDCIAPASIGLQGIAAVSAAYTAYESLQAAYQHFLQI